MRTVVLRWSLFVLAACGAAVPCQAVDGGASCAPDASVDAGTDGGPAVDAGPRYAPDDAGLWVPTDGGREWRVVPLGDHPSARYGAAMAYDSARQMMVLFGGYGAPALNDTWEYDGEAWHQRLPVTAPPARRHAAMAYDPLRHRTLMCGGEVNTTAILSDCWQWDGGAWTMLPAGGNPPSRSWAGMAWDPARGAIILFGGTNGTAALSDTWVWNGTTWTSLAAGTPPARQISSLAFDVERSRVVFFGGFPKGPPTARGN